MKETRTFDDREDTVCSMVTARGFSRENVKLACYTRYVYAVSDTLCYKGCNNLWPH